MNEDRKWIEKDEEEYEIWKCNGCESNCKIFMENRGTKKKPHGCFYDWGTDDYDKPNQFELETDEIDDIFDFRFEHTEEYKLMIAKINQRFDRLESKLEGQLKRIEYQELVLL